MKIFYVPLEKLEERYTSQMYQWVVDGFRRKGIAALEINGKTLTSGVQTGEVLDAEGTNYFKASQLMQICAAFKSGAVENGDMFFIADLWFPGIEMIRYIESQKGMKVKVAGVHYAGVYDPNDFVYKMRDWAEFNELGWLTMADHIFVGSEYHRKLILEGANMMVSYEEIEEMEKKMHATGLVWDADSVKAESLDKAPMVIFPHRTDKEKNPQDFFEVARKVKQQRPEVQFIITSSRKELSSNIPNFKVPDYVTLKVGLTKQEYYNIMGRCKVFFSSAYQETFGYALNEALALKCIPICPARLSYPEVLENDSKLLYININDAIEKVLWALDTDYDVSRYTQKYSKNIDRMLTIMTKG